MLVTVVVSLLAIPATASAFNVRDGSVEITVRKSFQQSAAQKGVDMSPIGSASSTGLGPKFPILGGTVKPRRRVARLRLGGGIRWSAPSSTTGAEVTTNNLAVIVRGRRGVWDDTDIVHRELLGGEADHLRLFKLRRVRFGSRGRIKARLSLAPALARELNQVLGLGPEGFRARELVGSFSLLPAVQR